MAFVRVVPALAVTFSVLLASACLGQVDPQAPDEIRTAGDLLRALENADNGLEAISAQISYERRFLLQGDRHVRRGDLYYAQADNDEGVRERRFGVHFSVLYLDDRREEDEQIFLFDGEWLIEKRPQQLQYIARQIAPEGAEFDPLRLGEGPIPFPLGQRAEDVRQRYDPMLVDTLDGLEDESDELRKFVAEDEEDGESDYWHIRLVPHREAAADDDFDEINIWYDKETLLPRMALTINRGGDVSVVMLLNVTRTTVTDLPDDALSIEPPSQDSGWDIQIEPYRGDE